MSVINPANFNERVDVPKGALINVHQSDGGRLAFDLVEFDPSGGGSVPDATTSVKGIVKLAADGGTDANTAVQGNDTRLVGGGVISVLSATWQPADVTQDEVQSAVLVVPAPCLVLGSYWQRDIPTDAGSTPTLLIVDDLGLFYSGAMVLASDDTTKFSASHATRSFLVSSYNDQNDPAADGLSLYAAISFDFTYVAGLTPGVTKPRFTLAFVTVPM